MAEWKEYKLYEIVENFIDYRGKTPQKTESGIPLVTAKIVKAGKIQTPNEFIAHKNYATWMRRGYPEINDIVLTTEAPLGEVALLKDKHVALAQRIILIRAKKYICDNAFLKYYLQCEAGQNELQGRASGSTVEGIKASELKQIAVALPPLPEQRAIAGVLSSLDDKIDLLHRQNETLESLAETLWRKMFVEDANTEWAVDVLDNLFDIGIGRTPPRKENQWFSTTTEGVKWISIKDMGGAGVYVDSVSEYLTKEAIRNFHIPLIPSNTVLLSFKMTIGRLAITGEEMTSNEAIAHFKINKKSYLTSEYLYFFLKCFRFENLGSTSSIVEAINSQMIREITISVPSEETIREFKCKSEKYFSKMATNLHQIHTLAYLRKILLPKLMMGEMRVHCE